MRKMKFQQIALNMLAVVLVFVAGTGVSANCWFTAYEPDVPECLKR
jgi:cyclic lactone autoinducer peptide